MILVVRLRVELNKANGYSARRGSSFGVEWLGVEKGVLLYIKWSWAMRSGG